MSPNVWLAIGLTGQAAYGTRFLIQWIASEKRGRSVIPVHFWYWSVVAAVLLLLYAIYRRDPVFIVGEIGAGLIYVRNLMLIRQSGPANER